MLLLQVGLAGDPTTAVFGVFDGHGGAEVAKFCQKYMAKEIQKLEQFGEGNVEDSLVQVCDLHACCATGFWGLVYLCLSM